MSNPVDITIYTTSSCPYCHRAKALLTERGLAYEEISVDGDPEERSAMTQKAGGSRTVPQIFIGGTHIGGCDELHALARNGELDTLLADAAQ